MFSGCPNQRFFVRKYLAHKLSYFSDASKNFLDMGKSIFNSILTSLQAQIPQMFCHASRAPLLAIPRVHVKPDKVLLFKRCKQKRNPLKFLPWSFQTLGLQHPEERIDKLGELDLEVGARVCRFIIEQSPCLEVAGSCKFRLLFGGIRILI